MVSGRLPSSASLASHPNRRIFLMTQLHRTYCCRLACVSLLLVAMSCCSSAPCHAQSKTIRWLIHEFVGVGGYWFTDSSARNALGSPKFGGTTSIFVKPAHRFGAEID